MEPLLDKDFSIYNSVILKLEEIFYFFFNFHVLSSESHALRKHTFRVGHTACLSILTSLSPLLTAPSV